MKFTIERIRTLVLAAGVLLVVAIAAFLAVGKWKNPFNRGDIPKRLGIDIQQEANGVTYTQAHGGHTIFKIHASKVDQLRNSHAELHDVQIDLYGADGNSVDRIVGDEFEYDQSGGTATAAGPVEITLMRPGEKPAIASEPLVEKPGGKKPQPVPAVKPQAGSGAPASKPDTKGQIDVKTSGLVFNQHSGVATTMQRVDFSSVQGNGSSIGATYDSQKGLLILDHAVELTTRTSDLGGPGAEPVEIHAAHAEFDRDSRLCRMSMVTAKARSEQASAAATTILFRDDGSVQNLDASGGFNVSTATGSRLGAPAGTMSFDEDNQPRHAHLEGGVTMDSTNGGRVMHGTAPTMELDFDSDGDLRHAHLERGVEMQSDAKGRSLMNGQTVAVAVTRRWRSQVADVDFRDAGNGQVEPANIHGTGDVVITGETRRGNAPPIPSSLAADDVTGEFGPGSALTRMTGTGHARMEQTTAAGAKQMASGDRFEAHFLEAHFVDAHSIPGAAGTASSKATVGKGTAKGAVAGAEQVQSAVIDGHVVLVQIPAQQPGAQAGAPPQPPLRATAGRAEYEGAGSAAGEWLHLIINPRVENGGLQLTADKVDVAESSGDAFAHGNVKATWTGNGLGNGLGNDAAEGDRSGFAGADGLALGGKSPAHVIAEEAQLHQTGGGAAGSAGASGEATFRGHARLWQDANSVAAPVIALNRQKQTLTANSTDPAEPVRVVMVSAGGGVGGKSSMPSVIRVRGGDLWYSDVERRALMHGGVLGNVVADTGGVESVSDQVELFLAPAATGANTARQSEPRESQSRSGQAQSQVDRMTATGHVVLTSQGRRGTGQQLTYSSRAGDYVLTGTPSAMPRMTDPLRGSVTGETLIFHSRDNSVNVEGGSEKTRTETTAPR